MALSLLVTHGTILHFVYGCCFKYRGNWSLLVYATFDPILFYPISPSLSLSLSLYIYIYIYIYIYTCLGQSDCIYHYLYHYIYISLFVSPSLYINISLSLSLCLKLSVYFYLSSFVCNYLFPSLSPSSPLSLYICGAFNKFPDIFLYRHLKLL